MSTTVHRIKLLKETGEVQYLTTPPIPVASRRKKIRFSEIIPTNLLLRTVFRFIRFTFGEDGRLAEWTRNWQCEKVAIILIGRNRGKRMVSHSRQALVDWEHEQFFEPKFQL